MNTHRRPIFKINVVLIVGVTQFRDVSISNNLMSKFFCLKRSIRFDETFQYDVDPGSVVVY